MKIESGAVDSTSTQKDFTGILLCKDGGEKFRSHTPVTIEQLNRVIDAMPMRQQEMQWLQPR